MKEIDKKELKFIFKRVKWISFILLIFLLIVLTRL
jgi:hypothetical protein